MNRQQGQTAIGGVLSVFSINVVTRIVSYARHILITSFIGLTGGLDAFFAALSVAGMVVFVLGDVFDSVGVPRMVRERSEKGEEEFREIAFDVVKVSIAMSVAGTALLVAVSPLAHWVVPGFPEEQKGEVLRYLLLFVPMCLVYLPYHAMGSVLRASRRFSVFYVAELITGIATIVVLLVWHDSVDAVAFSWSTGYLFGLIYLVFAVRRHLAGSWRRWGGERISSIVRAAIHLLPAYLVSQFYVLVDRVVGSYLPAGSISSLYYGLFLATAIPSLLAMENILITPMAESSDKSDLFSRIFKGIVLLYVPVAVFVWQNAELIVSILFERGVFQAKSVQMTAAVLSIYVLALPVWGIWGIVVRIHQIMERFKVLILTSFGVLVAYTVMGYGFSLTLGLGLRGLPLASLVAAIVLAGIGIANLERIGVSLKGKSIVEAVARIASFGILSGVVTASLPLGDGRIGLLAARLVVYLACYSLLIFLFAGKCMDGIKSELVWNIRNLKESLF